MCRRNQLCGSCLIAAGVGILAGMLLETGFLVFLLGSGLIGLGFWCMGRK